MKYWIIAPLALLALATAPDCAHAQFRFTRIADTANRFAGLNAPALNDSGQVAFGGDLSSGGPGIFVGNGGVLTTVADTSGRFQFFGFPAIDANGQVSFFANLQGGAPGIFAGVGGAVTIADTSGEIANFGVGDPSGAPGGKFTAFPVNLKNGRAAVLMSDGANLTTIADTSGAFRSFDPDPRVNAAGQVAFLATLRTSGSGIFVSDGVSLTPIADTSTTFSDFSGAPSINDLGAVAFGANLKAGGGGIFVRENGRIRPLVDGSGLFDDFLGFSQPIINGRGQVAFLGGLDDGRTGLFVGPDPVRDRVLMAGDALDGSKVASLQLFGEAFNNRRELAFTATLEDGRTGIYRADPVLAAAAPEPGGLALWVGLCPVVLALRRRKL